MKLLDGVATLVTDPPVLKLPLGEIHPFETPSLKATVTNPKVRVEELSLKDSSEDAKFLQLMCGNSKCCTTF